MKLENQVVSLGLSKRLKELGVKQDSQFYWRAGYSVSESFDNGVSKGKQGHFGDFRIEYLPKPRYTTANVKWNEADLAILDSSEISALTVAELGGMLPWQIGGRILTIGKAKDGWWMVCYEDNVLGFPIEKKIAIEDQGADTEADARAKMLIYLLENKLI